jgi:pimeloyl-ACP methyl ester carboxylesterase
VNQRPPAAPSLARDKGTDFSAALIPGPWTHRFISANGSRFHVAMAGPTGHEAPLVILLHGFLEFWWQWRYQLSALGEAGYRVVAMDLRGHAASDKPPEGNDLPTLTRDVAAVIASLGAAKAHVIGSGLGGIVGWTMAALEPRSLASLVVVGAPHPAQLWRPSLLVSPRAFAQMALLRAPVVAERALLSGTLVGSLLSTWSAVEGPSRATVRTYREMMRIPYVAAKSVDQMRWLLGTYRWRRPRRRLMRRFDGAESPVPVLHLHGAEDGLLRTASIAAPRYGGADYHLRVLQHVGHFPEEEAPEVVTEALLKWLGGIERPGAAAED